MKKIILIFLIALFFRFWNLTSYPVHLSMDEVAISVAARQILNTGHDEWGYFMPLAFKSASDYKPPVNVYLTAFSQLFFGVNEFSTRFVSAFLGSITVISIAYLAKELKIKYWWIAGLVIAVSPWHTHFSRASFEAVTALFFAVSGLYFFLKYVNKKVNLYFYLSLITFSLAVWAYHAERVFVPILFICLLIIYRKQIFYKNFKKIINKSALILIFFGLPFLYLTFFTPAIRERAAATSFMRDPSFYNSLHHGEYNNITEFIFDNDYFLIFKHWSGKYLNYFDIRFIFWKGMQLTPPEYPGIGLVYLANLPLVLLGFKKLSIFKNKQTKNLLLVLLFLGPLPATFSMNDQHPLRALTWLPFFALIISLGFDQLKKLNKKYKILIFSYFIFLIFNIFYFKNIYTKQFPRLYSEPWQYGYEEVTTYACNNAHKYDQVFVSESFGATEQFTSLPAYYLEYYCGYEKPENVEIKRPLWEVDQFNYKNALFIAAPWDFPKDLEESRIIKKIHFLNGKEAFWFVETK